MVWKYSTESGPRRWPIQVFYNMLDLARINYAILYKEVTGEKLSPKDYPLSLVAEMQQIFMNPSWCHVWRNWWWYGVSRGIGIKKNENNAKWDYV